MGIVKYHQKIIDDQYQIIAELSNGKMETVSVGKMSSLSSEENLRDMVNKMNKRVEQ
jgi:hypothetical protein